MSGFDANCIYIVQTQVNAKFHRRLRSSSSSFFFNTVSATNSSTGMSRSDASCALTVTNKSTETNYAPTYSFNNIRSGLTLGMLACIAKN